MTSTQQPTRRGAYFANKPTPLSKARAAAAANNLTTLATKAPKSRAAVASPSVYEATKNSVGSISVFGINDPCGRAVNTGSCFLIDRSLERPGTMTVITAAHVVLPDFTEVNATNSPYIVDGASAGIKYGVTTFNEWPYAYTLDLYNSFSGSIDFPEPVEKRQFFDATLLGVDWETDIAVLEVYVNYPPTFPSNVEFIPLAAPIGAPVVGQTLFALSNMWAMDLANFVSGEVRQNEYQGNGLIVESTTTNVDLGTGSSGAAYINEDLEYVGIYTSSINRIGSTYTTGPAYGSFTQTITDILTATNYVESLPTTDPLGGFTVIMSISRYTLGVSATLLQVQDLNLVQPLPQNAGYIYRESLPYGPLQSLVRPKDLIFSIQPNPSVPPAGVYELGIYDTQFTMGQATAIASTDTLTAVNVYRWGVGGWDTSSTPTTFTSVKLQNQAGNTWTWWFQWLLPAAGAGIDVGNIDPMEFEDVVADTVARRQYERIVAPGPAFVPLDTASLRATEAGVPPSTEQSSRIGAIVNEVSQQLGVYMDSVAHFFDTDARGDPKRVGPSNRHDGREPKRVGASDRHDGREPKRVGASDRHDGREPKRVGASDRHDGREPKRVGASDRHDGREPKRVGASNRHDGREPKRVGAEW